MISIISPLISTSTVAASICTPRAAAPKREISSPLAYRNAFDTFAESMQPRAISIGLRDARKLFAGRLPPCATRHAMIASAS